MTGIEGKSHMVRMLDTLRKTPPKTIGGLAVTSFEDLRDENGRMGPLKGATDAASRNFLIFRLGDMAKVVLRPSGTEPKAKAYLEVRSAPWKAGISGEAWDATCREGRYAGPADCDRFPGTGTCNRRSDGGSGCGQVEQVKPFGVRRLDAAFFPFCVYGFNARASENQNP